MSIATVMPSPKKPRTPIISGETRRGARRDGMSTDRFQTTAAVIKHPQAGNEPYLKKITRKNHAQNEDDF